MDRTLPAQSRYDSLPIVRNFSGAAVEGSDERRSGPSSTASRPIARRGFVWIGLGLFMLVGALAMAVGSVWLMIGAPGVAGEFGEGGEDRLFVLGGILSACMALFAAGLGGLAINHGLEKRLSRVRYSVRHS